MDPRIKQEKLKNVWVECTAAKNDDDLDWCQYFAEQILENSGRVSSSADLFSLLTSDLESIGCVTDITEDSVKQALCAAVWEKIKKPEAPKEVRKEKPEIIPVSLGKLNNVFKKEIAKRKYGGPELTAEIMACQPHDFFSAVSHGERCQICDFETTKDIWSCRKNCGASLCGSCAFKWKNKC